MIMQTTTFKNSQNKAGLPAIASLPYRFNNENDAEGKFLLHSNIIRVYARMNKKGRYADWGELQGYIEEIVEAKTLKWITVTRLDESNCILFISGFGIIPSDVRGILNRKLNIGRIESAHMEIKAFPVCSEKELRELAERVLERKEFVKQDSLKSGEQRKISEEPAKEYVLHGSYEKYDLKLYKILGVNSDTYSFELIDKTPLSEQDFDKSIGDMIAILKGFDKGRYKTIQEVVFSEYKLKQPYGRIVQSKKTRNKIAPKNARAEALQRIDRDGRILYTDLCSLFAYNSKKRYAPDKMASKFILSNHLARLIDNGQEIVKRDMAVAV